jgi:putative membrane protein
MTDAGHNASNRLSQQRTELAVTRTTMAADRTLMAWTRTSLAMISFGFTVYKFMQYLREEDKAILIRTERGAQNFGMALIALNIGISPGRWIRVASGISAWRWPSPASSWLSVFWL